MNKTLFSSLLASATGLSAATIGGAVCDSGARAVPSAYATFSNPATSMKQQAATNSNGRFSFDNLAAGSYVLHIQKPGFASLYREFNVEAEDEIHRGITLKADTATTSRADGGPVRVSGTFEESKLVAEVHPIYPPEAKAAGIQGTVWRR